MGISIKLEIYGNCEHSADKKLKSLKLKCVVNAPRLLSDANRNRFDFREWNM